MRFTAALAMEGSSFRLNAFFETIIWREKWNPADRWMSRSIEWQSNDDPSVARLTLGYSYNYNNSRLHLQQAMPHSDTISRYIKFSSFETRGF